MKAICLGGIVSLNTSPIKATGGMLGVIEDDPTRTLTPCINSAFRAIPDSDYT
jgi:hypothetical protein